LTITSLFAAPEAVKVPLYVPVALSNPIASVRAFAPLLLTFPPAAKKRAYDEVAVVHLADRIRDVGQGQTAANRVSRHTRLDGVPRKDRKISRANQRQRRNSPTSASKVESAAGRDQLQRIRAAFEYSPQVGVSTSNRGQRRCRSAACQGIVCDLSTCVAQRRTANGNMSLSGVHHKS
jgi:hypothetical protein